MIDFYTGTTSNGHRAALMVAECGLPYTVHKLDLSKGETRTEAFAKVNPAMMVPTIVDRDGPGGAPITVTQSAAILIYLAEKAGKFMPTDPARRAQMWQWYAQAMTDTAMTGVSAYYMLNFVPEKSEANAQYFRERTVFHLTQVNARLAGRDYLADEVSIADFALLPTVNGRVQWVQEAGLTHVLAWLERMKARPGVQVGLSLSA